MGWQIELEKAGWREATEREYKAFLGEHIFGKEDEEKEKLVNESKELMKKISGCVEYIVPVWYKLQ